MATVENNPFAVGRFRLALLATVAAGVCGAAAPSQPPALTVTLKPAAADGAGHVPWIDVVVREREAAAAAGGALLRMPLVLDNVVTPATALQDFSVSDAQGALPVTVHDDAEAGGVTYRHWLAGRAVSGPVTVRYRVGLTNALPARGAAPPLDLRTDDGGFGGAGGDFLVLPDDDAPRRMEVRWDLSAQPKGAIGMSSLGVGDVAAPEPSPARELETVYFMGGAIGRYPDPPPAQGFISGWEGKTPFDATALMAWTKTLHDRYAVFFRDPSTRPYAVFLRKNLVNSGGGVELGRSFVGSYGDGMNLEEFKVTLAHEMLHTWVQGLSAPQGLAGSWFSEGMAVQYARRLALRFDHITPDQFLKDLNGTAGRYYTDALNDAPNDQIPARFWADTRIRVLPYDRGSMYFAVVDSEVREASGGKRSLDDLLLSMLDRRTRGQPMDQAAWVETVTGALGPRGKTEFEAMLAGALQLPPSDAFGPCFRRTTKPLRRYELGFDPKVLVEPRRIVRGLIAGSAAEQAGLKDGDEIVRPVPQDSIQGDQTRLITLEIRRGGREFPLTYLPRGETVQAFQWERVPGVPDRACAF